MKTNSMGSIFGNRTLSARHEALTWLERGCVFYDCESTGLTNSDVAIDIAVLDVSGKVLFESLIQPPPGVRVSDSAWLVHGISDAMLRDAPGLPDVYGALFGALRLKEVITFNQDYDKRIMRQTCRAWGYGIGELEYDWRCAMLLAQDAMGVRKWPRLDEAADRYDVKALGAHRARFDAETTRQIVLRIAGVI